MHVVPRPLSGIHQKYASLLAALYLQSTVSQLKQQALFSTLFSLEFAVLSVRSVITYNINMTSNGTTGRFKNVSEINKKIFESYIFTVWASFTKAVSRSLAGQSVICM